MTSFSSCNCASTSSSPLSSPTFGYPLSLSSPRRMSFTTSNKLAISLDSAAIAAASSSASSSWTSSSLPPFSSYASSSSGTSSVASSEGIRTPPTSPGRSGHDELDFQFGSIKIVEDDSEVLPFELEEVDLHEKHFASPIHSSQPLPSPVVPSQPLQSTVPLPTVQPIPTPRKPKSRPSRADEETRRGRSRWPRVLWRSELDTTSELGEETLEILDQYHQRAVGGHLPVLKRHAKSSEVKEWSNAMERAGL